MTGEKGKGDVHGRNSMRYFELKILLKKKHFFIRILFLDLPKFGWMIIRDFIIYTEET